MFTIILLHMYQIFSSLRGHLQFSVHFFFTFMVNFFFNHRIYLSRCRWRSFISDVRLSSSPSRLSSSSFPLQCTRVQNNQESRHKYWAIHSSVCLFAYTAHSFACSTLLVRSAVLTHLLAGSLTHSLKNSLLHSRDSEWLDGYICCFFICCLGGPNNRASIYMSLSYSAGTSDILTVKTSPFNGGNR